MNIDKYLLFDGAMGTYYASKNRPYSLSKANLMDYNTIVSIHREYIKSGAMAITTNTFGVIDEQSIIFAYNAAIDAASGTSTLIFCSIGPINGFETSGYIATIDTLLKLGASNFIFETFATEEIVLELADYIKSQNPESFIITSFAVDQNGYTSYGKFYNDIIINIKQNVLIDSYGFNCVCGLLHMKELAGKLNKNDILSIMPNAGYPSIIDGKPSYIDNPLYFARKILEIHNLGVKIVGGCCGTTPKHIEEARKLLDESVMSPNQEPILKENKIVVIDDNNFKNKLLDNKMVILVEYDAPLKASGSDVTNAAITLEKAGIDAITIADNPLGRARADSLIVAARIKRVTNNITVIPHITCRDRNSISILSALMGLNIEDINNIICVTGDPVPTCYIEQAKGVFSFGSTSLISYIESINNESITSKFFIGAALNINANRFDLELNRATKKIDAGADYFITQSCFSEKSIENVMQAKKLLKVPIIVGIMPIKSYRNASFIKSEIAGIDIPDEVVNMYKDKTLEECEDISIKYSLGTVKKLLKFANGFHIITPPNGEHVVVKLIKEINKL